MSLTQLPLFNTEAGLAGFGTTDLNASGLKFATFFRANGKQITKGRVNVSSVTTPPRYDVVLQGLSAKTTPSGTDLGGGSPTLTAFTPVAGVQDVTLTNAYTPTLGDMVAIVCEYYAAGGDTIDTTHHAVFNIRQGSLSQQMPSLGTFNGTTWSGTATQYPPMTVVYSDGTVPLETGSAVTTNTDFNNTSTTKEYGIHFVPDVNYTIIALRWATAGNVGQGKLTIYNGSNTVLTGSDNVTTVATDYNGAPSAATINIPITALTLTAGTDYYMAVSPTSASNIRIQKQTYPDASAKEALFGKASFIQRNTIGSGAWTEDTSSIALMTPIASALAGSGGSGGTPILQSAIIQGLGVV